MNLGSLRRDWRGFHAFGLRKREANALPYANRRNPVRICARLVQKFTRLGFVVGGPDAFDLVLVVSAAVK